MTRVPISQVHWYTASAGCVADMGGTRGGPGRVVILGGGIMGCSTAYFLTKLGHQAQK